MDAAFIADVLRNYPVLRDPPGCWTEIVADPGGRNAAMEIGIVQEHRFAFFYWLKWRQKQLAEQKIAEPPDLITVDWHDDVGGECDFLPETLRKLDTADLTELALFSWCGLRPLNDGHIAPAVFLNAVKDVYVILKQKADDREFSPEQCHYAVTDSLGNDHAIHYYSTVREFLREHDDGSWHPVIFDLDLDYFTRYEGEGFPTREMHRAVPNRTIRRFFRYDSPFMQWLFPRMRGMTIALEPEYCGGVHNCLRILDVVGSSLFDPPLLRNDCGWKHLKH